MGEPYKKQQLYELHLGAVESLREDIDIDKDESPPYGPRGGFKTAKGHIAVT